MTHYGPDVQGGATSTYLSNYLTAVSENFPRMKRLHTIESSVAARGKLDVLPVNLDANANNHVGFNDPYIKFRLSCIPGQFFLIYQRCL